MTEPDKPTSFKDHLRWAKAVENVAAREPNADEALVYQALAAYPHCSNIGGPCAECAAKIAITTLAAAGRLRDTTDAQMEASMLGRTTAVTPPPQRRRIMSRGLLVQVAETYRAAFADGQPPTRAVADQFDVSHRTAARWVSEARKLGILGKASGTRAGESAIIEADPA